MMDGASAVYYDFSVHNNDIGQHDTSLKRCSVRGCTQLVTDGLNNKMCDGCRGRHRIYATTKRARRKLEKAAVANSRASGNSLALIHESNSSIIVEKDHMEPVWMGNGQIIMEQGSSMANSQMLSHGHDSISYVSSVWDHDNELEMPVRTVQPHERSTASELAHALTLPPHHLLPAQHGTRMSALAMSIEPIGPTATMASSQHHALNMQLPLQEQSVSQAQENPKVPTRYCSVKGCKAVIPASYDFKMCPQCRVRYRTYGNTKRAKWKYERESFQKEMEGLRIAEDEKRQATGLKPLSDNPEELRAWELSIIDEQVPLPAVENLGSLSSLAGTISVGMPPSTHSEGSASFSPVYAAAHAYATSVSTVDTTHSASSHATVDVPYSGGSAAPLPARMCTVSHCHKILPGFYRYKRCEQHRLQNRYHSQLKRVREKEVKAAGPDQSMQAMDISSEMTEGDSAMGSSGVDECVLKAMRDRRLKMLRKRKKPVSAKKTKSSGLQSDKKELVEQSQSRSPNEVPIWDHQHATQGNDSPEILFVDPEVPSSASALAQGDVNSFTTTQFINTLNGNPNTVKKRQYEKLSKFSCASTDCHNLLTPGIRWRTCEDCRAIERQRRTEERVSQRETLPPAGATTIVMSGTNYPAQDGESSSRANSQNVIYNAAYSMPETYGGLLPDADDDSQSDADAEADGDEDEDGEGEVDYDQSMDVTHDAPGNALPEQANPNQGRQLIWKTTMPDDNNSWSGGFSKFRIEKPRLPSNKKEVSKNHNQSKSLSKTMLTTNDGASARHLPGPADKDGTNIRQSTNGNIEPVTAASLAPSTLPTSELGGALESMGQVVANAQIQEAVSSKAKGKRKAASEDVAVNSNTAPPPPIPVASGSFAAPYGYPPSYPYYSYYMPPYPVPPYPYAPAMGPPGAATKAQFPPPGPPPVPHGYLPYPGPYQHPQHYPQHHHPSHPPLHSQGYGFGPSSGMPYLPPRYPTPHYGQTSGQMTYGGFIPPNNAPSNQPYNPSYPPGTPQYPPTDATSYDYYRTKPAPPPSSSTKKKRSKANNAEDLTAQRGANDTVPPPPLPHQSMNTVVATTSAFFGAQTENSAGSRDAENGTNPLTDEHVAVRATRQCTTCKRTLPQTCPGSICEKCKQRFKKHQIKAKQKYKLEPRKFLLETTKPSATKPLDSGGHVV